MISTHLIFVGFELTDQVKRMLEMCADRDRVYLNDPAHIETIAVGDKRYVGKRIKDGAALDRIEDTARSVVSLLSRINSTWDQGADAAMVVALVEGPDGGEAIIEDVVEEVDDDSKEFDYSGLVD